MNWRSTIRSMTMGGLLVCAIVAAWRPTGSAQPAAKEAAAVVDASKYATLQEAFDAVPQGGGLVKLPPGTFEITKPIVVTRENLRIEGCGAATHLVNKNEEGEPALVLQAADWETNKRSRIWRVQLADFRISGNPKSGDGVVANGVNEIYISGLAVDHNGGNGVSLVDCYEDPRVSDSIFTYNKRAGLSILRGHDIVVNANQFEENEDALRCVDSFNLCMNGNNIDDHLRHGVVIENTYGSVLSGNMIEECKGTAVILDRDCYGNTISANVIAHNGAGVDLRDAWGCAVSANTFTIVKERALVVGPGSGRITVTGNNFSDSHIGGKVKREDAAAGVTLEGTADVVVTGNVFSGLTAPAVEADDLCQHIVISGNAVVEPGRGRPEAVPALKLGKAGAVATGNSVPE